MLGYRITGNEKLDPDFSKIKWKEKKLGILRQRDLYKPGSQEWLLPRINPSCENCGENKGYDLLLLYRSILVFFKVTKRIHLVCPECSENVELDYKEYATIEPFMEKVR